MLLGFAHHGVSLDRVYLKKAVGIFMDTLPKARRAQFQFSNGVPGDYFLRKFKRRHKSKLRIGKPLRQDTKIWAAVNADSLTTYLAVFEKLVRDNYIDGIRLWNLDETGVTLNKADEAFQLTRQYTDHRNLSDVIVPEVA